jgi:WD40 repeat protein
MPAAKLVLELKHPQHACAVTRIELAPGGRRLAAIYQQARQIGLWDVARAEVAASLSAAGPRDDQHIWFSPDGKTMVAASFDGFWTAPTGEEPRKLLEDDRALRKIFRSPDGTLAAVQTIKGLRLLNVISGECAEPLNYVDPYEVSFTSDGQRLLVLRSTPPSDKETYILDLWDLSDGWQQPTFFQPIDSLAIPRVVLSPDHSQIATVQYRAPHEPELRIIRLRDGKVEKSFGGDYFFTDPGLAGISDLVFSYSSHVMLRTSKTRNVVFN